MDLKAWWTAQTSTTKAIVGVGAFIAALVAVNAVSKPKRLGYTPNCKTRRSKKKKPKRKAASKRKAAKRKRQKYWQRAYYVGAPTAPRTAPKAEYARAGATRPEHYAYPSAWKYPIHTAYYARKSAQRFGKWKGRITPHDRAMVARRIDAAKRRFGIGEYRRPARKAAPMREAA